MEASGLTLTLDLCGVFVLALSGALAAVQKQLDVVGVVVLGIVAAIGGGSLRDVLLREIPLVLRTGELHAVAAVFVIRVVATRRNWAAPLPRGVTGET